jgi:hypothetical protein
MTKSRCILAKLQNVLQFELINLKSYEFSSISIQNWLIIMIYMHIVIFGLLNISPVSTLISPQRISSYLFIHFTQLSKVLRCKELFYNFLFHLFLFQLFAFVFYIIFIYSVRWAEDLESILKPIANVESVVFWCSQESDALPTELHRGKRKLLTVHFLFNFSVFFWDFVEKKNCKKI